MECAICYEAMSDENAAELPCGGGHAYHHSCAAKWMARAYIHADFDLGSVSCPTCRSIFPEAELCNAQRQELGRERKIRSEAMERESQRVEMAALQARMEELTTTATALTASTASNRYDDDDDGENSGDDGEDSAMLAHALIASLCDRMECLARAEGS